MSTSEEDRLQLLRDKISEDVDYLIFDEAVKCLRTDAYRAAYIMTWISVAESLRNKFNVMSSRDAEVGRILRKIESLEDQDRPADKMLVSEAARIGMITDDEATKLEHMRQMRNIYAHPTGAGLGAEEVAAALVVAVDTVLSRSPLLRHGYVNALLDSLFEDRHYLDDVPALVREYGSAAGHRIHPDVLPYLVDKLAGRLEQALGDPDLGIFGRRGLEFGTALLAAVRPDLSAEVWNVPLLVQRYPSACSLLLGTAENWPLLPEHGQDMVLGHLLEPVIGGEVVSPTGTSLRQARDLEAAGLMTKRQVERLQEAVQGAPYEALSEAGVELPEYASRIIDDLKGHNWYSQNPASDALRNAGPGECCQVDEEIQRQLGRNILQAAEGQANSPSILLSSAAKGEELWPEAFIEGVILESLVNDQGEFRLKSRHLWKATTIAASHPSAGKIFEHLTEAVRESKPKYDWDMASDYDDALEKIAEVPAAEEATSKGLFRGVCDAINWAKSHAVDETGEEAFEVQE